MTNQCMRKVVVILSVLGVAVAATSGQAAEGVKEPVEIDWPHKGPFGTFDRSALQRGFKVYDQVCATCHSMNHLYYRNLEGIGFTPEEVKAIAAEHQVTDGPDEYGDMYQRPAKPSDRFAAPFPNDQAARSANNGALPADLSVIVKARPGHENYLYSLLTGYADPPEDFELRAGMSYNEYFDGHQIAMPQPLFDDFVEYQDGTPATVDQMARDVTQFLAWASEPMLEERKEMGFKVIGFLVILSLLLYRANKTIWARVKKQNA